MITLFLGHLCEDSFDLKCQSKVFHSLFAVEILNSLSLARPLGGKVFLQWADTPNVLLAMKYLWETESVNGPSGATGHLIHGIRSPLDIQMNPRATQQR